MEAEVQDEPVPEPAREDSVKKVANSVAKNLQDLVQGIPDKHWIQPRGDHRDGVLSVNFGLQKVGSTLGKASKDLPEVQDAILQAARVLAPDLKFTSFILNYYGPGVGMGLHKDHNLKGDSLQLVFIWGDFEGGQLTLDDGTTEYSVRKGVYLVDGNVEHEVKKVDGERWSIVTYAKSLNKKTEESIAQLREWGFPLPEEDLS